jgi:hypothetical protein
MFYLVVILKLFGRIEFAFVYNTTVLTLKMAEEAQKLISEKAGEHEFSRSTSFNQHNVTMFCDNYEKALQQTHFTPDRIFSLDETSIMTVVQAPRVIVQTGSKQGGQCVFAERGQLITVCARHSQCNRQHRSTCFRISQSTVS